MTSVRVPGFSPSQHGFHFENTWPHEPDVSIPTLAGPVPIGDAHDGLCGGMAYAARDMFEVGVPVPIEMMIPTINTPLYAYFVRRLVDSFDLPVGVGLWQSWSSPLRNQARDMVLTEWPQIRAQLNGGTLVAVGLVRVKSFWIGDWGANHQVIAWGFDEDAAHNVSILFYDPNHPDDDNVRLSFNASNPDARITVSFTTSDGPGAGDESTFGAFVLPYTRVDPRPMLAMLQNDWRWCSKCQGLFFAGNPGSVCPAGGTHGGDPSFNYTLTHNATSVGQSGWRWCRRCQGLFFEGNPGSHCPAGDRHEAIGSGDYIIVDNLALAQGQDNWRWCNKCQGFFFGGNPTQGVCPAAGAHDSTGSGNYVLAHD